MKQRRRFGSYARAVALCWMVSVAAESATTYYVAMDGLDSRTGTGDWTNALRTIGAAVTKATATQAGDTILVSTGVYAFTADSRILYGTSVFAVSTNPADTVMDGSGSTRGIVHISHSNSVVSGFTITNGYSGTSGYGSGVTIDGTGGTLTNCVIVGNTGACAAVSIAIGTVRNSVIRWNTMTNTSLLDGGGGVRLSGVSALIRDCVIQSNVSLGLGGGIFATSAANGLASNCIVSGNSAVRGGGIARCRFVGGSIVGNVASGFGGGIYNMQSSGMLVSDCMNISGNRATHGGGAFIEREGYISNCVIYNNTATSTANDGGGGGIEFCGSHTSSQWARNCVISNNTAISMGGGILSYYRTVISNCTIIGNTAGVNGGGAWVNTDGTICDCVLRGNTASNMAGGVYLFGGSRLINCEISGNQAATNYAGGVLASAMGAYPYSLYTGMGYIVSCTIAGNSALKDAGGLYVNGDGWTTNSIIYSNSATTNPDINYAGANYSNYFWNCCSARLLNQSQGNTTIDPQFVDVPGGNYRLKTSSPCINAGLNQNWMAAAFDLDGRPRLDRFRGIVDMGAYEFLLLGTMITVK